MTTHRRAWALRAGVVALVAGALLGVPSPASAAAPGVQITQLSSGTLRAGERATLKFRVQNNNLLDPGKKDSARINVSSSFGELRCEGRCDFDEAIDPQQSKEFEVTLVASANVQAGQTRSGRVRITATINGETGTAERDITVRGPDQAPAIRRISGTIRDQSTGDPIDDAKVTIRDSRNQSFETRTDGDGGWEFTSSQERPIAPGNITITVRAEGYRDITKRREVAAGASATGIRISMFSTEAPTPSPSAEPSEDPIASEDPVATGEPTGAAINPASGEQDSGGTLSWMLIILGGLLVALGVGAIVLLLVRRKEDGEADEEQGVPAGAGPRGLPPGGRGAYAGAGGDPTRVTNRAGMGGDATMYAPPGLSEAQTMMQPAVLADEFPDPYGAPLPGRPPQPGWGDTSHGINGAPQPGFGAPPPPGYGGPPPPAPYAGPAGGPGPYGSPVGPGAFDGPGGFDSPGGFDGPAPFDGQGGFDRRNGGYPDRYDEPTGMFNGGAAGYGKPTGSPYEPEPYGSGGPDRPAAGYGPGGGYEPRDAGYDDGYGGGGGGGGFEPPRGGYDGPAEGYGRPPAGYDDGYEHGNAGYDAPRAGYDARGGGYEPHGSGYEPHGGGYDRDGFDRGSDRGWEPRGDDRGYYEEPGGGAHSRHGAPPAGRGGDSGRGDPGRGDPARGERRPLDWLDD